MLNNIYGGGTFENYSTDEQVIGTQINGKPLYRRTFVYSGSIPRGTKLFENNLKNIDYIEKYSQPIFNTNLANNESEYGVASNDYLMALLGKNNNTNTAFIYVNYGTSRSSVTKLIVTVQYTKTTD